MTHYCTVPINGRPCGLPIPQERAQWALRLRRKPLTCSDRCLHRREYQRAQSLKQATREAARNSERETLERMVAAGTSRAEAEAFIRGQKKVAAMLGG